MPLNRQPSQKAGKSPRRTRIDPHAQYRIMKRGESARRANSTPPRATASSVEERNSCRCSSPRKDLACQVETLRIDSMRKSSSPLAQRRSNSRQSTSFNTRSKHCLLDAAEILSSTCSDEDDSDMKELCQLLVAHGGPTGSKKAEDFKHACQDPPVTKQSLGELDIASIVNNPKLRHDINFDRELHFRPNLDGARGKVKLGAQAEYWSSLVAELELYAILFGPSTSYDTATLERLRKRCKQRIPRMFAVARDILKALVSEQEQINVDAHLDVEVLMQEIERGVCDLPRIAHWIENVLKRHCAPMRDPLIDKMVSCITQGAAENSAVMLVEGLVQLFAALEAMKLDVANHQIRHLRLALIEDTVNFERQYHSNRIARRRIDCERSRTWYRQSGADVDNMDSMGQLDVFLHSLLTLILCPFSPEPFPDTFVLDAERLRNLRFDICDLFCLDACEKVFTEMGETAGLSVSQEDKSGLRAALSSVITLAPFTSNWDENLQNVTLEIIRHLVPALRRAGQQVDAVREQTLNSAADLALRKLFSDQKRSYFWSRGCQIREQIFPFIATYVRRFLNVSPVDAFTAFMSHNGDASLRQKLVLGRIAPHSLSADAVLADVVRRVAHIAVLHWRVWSPVYLHDPLVAMSAASSSSPSSPVTVEAKRDEAAQVDSDIVASSPSAAMSLDKTTASATADAAPSTWATNQSSPAFAADDGQKVDGERE